MDPFLEMHLWRDFHSRFITDVADVLNETVQPRYFVQAEQRVFIEREVSGSGRSIWPDVHVREEDTRVGVSSNGNTAAATLTPVRVTLPAPAERRETFLIIKEMPSRTVVTVLEILSPANKKRGSTGRKVYLKKREDILLGDVNLVEIDLLRGGKRMPMSGEIPPGDYCALVSKVQQQPTADLYSWTIHDPLPTIPIPLGKRDADVMLDLQIQFSRRFERAGYGRVIDYDQRLKPRLSDADAAWVTELLADRRATGSSDQPGE